MSSKYFDDIDYKLLDKKTAYRGKRIMVKEPRTPIGKNVLAFPAGMIEDGEIQTSSETVGLLYYFMYEEKLIKNK